MVQDLAFLQWVSQRGWVGLERGSPCVALEGAADPSTDQFLVPCGRLETWRAMFVVAVVVTDVLVCFCVKGQGHADVKLGTHFQDETSISERPHFLFDCGCRPTEQPAALCPFSPGTVS